MGQRKYQVAVLMRKFSHRVSENSRWVREQNTGTGNTDTTGNTGTAGNNWISKFCIFTRIFQKYVEICIISKFTYCRLRLYYQWCPYLARVLAYFNEVIQVCCHLLSNYFNLILQCPLRPYLTESHPAQKEIVNRFYIKRNKKW